MLQLLINIGHADCMKETLSQKENNKFALAITER